MSGDATRRSAGAPGSAATTGDPDAASSSQPPAGRLAGRLIALGVTGSIAAYKSVELLRLLTSEGADVAVLLSPAATRFVAPLTLAALSRHPVESELLELLPDGRIGHVVIADSADAIVVAPATAHWLGAMANGLAGDTVTAACLATTAPVVVAPAMDGEMYGHPATRANVARLRDEFGYTIVEPERGALASRQVGVGRLADLSRIVDATVAAVADRGVRAPDPASRPPITTAVRDADLAGRHIVVTAGGTAEPIDPVRFIGNRSTGRMGVAVAEAAIDRGAQVTLIAANVTVALPVQATVVRVESTGQMRAALLAATTTRDGAAGFDALVMAAAVADFRPVRPAETKLVRADALTLDLEPTPDLLAEVARISRGLDADGAPTRRPLEPAPLLVGFAAETGSLDRAAEKLSRKRVDFIVANDVTEPGSGFGTETNRVTILGADGSRRDLPMLPKREVADLMLDRIAAALDDRDTARQTAARTEPASAPLAEETPR
jgi:phosphopantothenoylcysteine decarboxylase/phosphopantothenate--cysteine ligase